MQDPIRTITLSSRCRISNQASRYKHVDDVSAILVHEKLLIQDAKKATLGEFICARLFNIYQPIESSDMFSEIELTYKKRVIGETLVDLLKYGEFATEIEVPFQYFVFRRLKERIDVYPSIAYGYAMTYSCEKGKENTEFASSGFRLAAKELGLTTSDYVRLSAIPGASWKRSLLFANKTKRTTLQHVIRAYAGLRSIVNLKDENVSKATRKSLDIPHDSAIQRHS